MEQVVEILKQKNYQIPSYLFFNYKKFNITDNEFILLIYLLNNNTVYNPKEISNSLQIKISEVLESVNNLCEKSIISIDITKINNVRTEIINFNLLYEKLAFIIMKKEDKNENKNLFDIFEQELGRTLSPIEYEIINGWKETKTSDELVLLALKEAIYNGVSNFRYIDKIIYEWGKKGIKSKEDVENNRKKFKNNSKEKNETFDYDWLNEDGNS